LARTPRGAAADERNEKKINRAVDTLFEKWEKMAAKGP
jgi:hypothetical protein